MISFKSSKVGSGKGGRCVRWCGLGRVVGDALCGEAPNPDEAMASPKSGSGPDFPAGPARASAADRPAPTPHSRTLANIWNATTPGEGGRSRVAGEACGVGAADAPSGPRAAASVRCRFPVWPSGFGVVLPLPPPPPPPPAAPDVDLGALSAFPATSRSAMATMYLSRSRRYRSWASKAIALKYLRRLSLRVCTAGRHAGAVGQLDGRPRPLSARCWRRAFHRRPSSLPISAASRATSEMEVIGWGAAASADGGTPEGEPTHRTGGDLGSASPPGRGDEKVSATSGRLRARAAHQTEQDVGGERLFGRPHRVRRRLHRGVGPLATSPKRTKPRTSGFLRLTGPDLVSIVDSGTSLIFKPVRII